MALVFAEVTRRDYVLEWRAKRKPLLRKRGAKIELAEWLHKRLGWTARSREVQISRILNQGAVPPAAWVLAVEEWIENYLMPKIKMKNDHDESVRSKRARHLSAKA
jgi:hypothetical protein